MHDPLFILRFALAIILVFFNWGTEAVKWKYIMQKLEPVSFLQSFKAILTGITVSTFTPNRIGEYFGRVFIMEKEHPIKGALVTIIGSISQLLVTTLFGAIAILFFVPAHGYLGQVAIQQIFTGISFIIILLTTGFALFYFNLHSFSPLLQKLFKNKQHNIIRFSRVFNRYSTKELFNIFLFSAFRYLIFSTQYILLIQAFKLPVSILESYVIVSIMFYILSAVPTISLSEIGVRGSICVFLFSAYFSFAGINSALYTMQIVSITTIIWLINLGIPALIGTFFVFNLRFIRNND